MVIVVVLIICIFTSIFKYPEGVEISLSTLSFTLDDILSRSGIVAALVASLLGLAVAGYVFSIDSLRKAKSEYQSKTEIIDFLLRSMNNKIRFLILLGSLSIFPSLFFSLSNNYQPNSSLTKIVAFGMSFEINKVTTNTVINELINYVFDTVYIISILWAIVEVIYILDFYASTFNQEKSILKTAKYLLKTQAEKLKEILIENKIEIKKPLDNIDIFKEFQAVKTLIERIDFRFGLSQDVTEEQKNKYSELEKEYNSLLKYNNYFIVSKKEKFDKYDPDEFDNITIFYSIYEHLRNALFVNVFSGKEISNISIPEFNLAGVDSKGKFSFSYSDLSNSNIKLIDFSFTKLTGALLKNCNLKGANFRKAILSETNFSDSVFTKYNYNDEIETKTEFEDKHYSPFEESVFFRTVFNGSILSYCELNNLDIKYSSFIHAKLNDAKIKNCMLNETNFEDAILINALLENCDFNLANMSNAILADATLFKSDVSRVNFNHSNMLRIKAFACFFVASNLIGVNAYDAALYDISFEKCSCSNAIFKQALIECSGFCFSLLNNSDFSSAILNYADLSFTDCSNALFIYAKFTCVRFVDALLYQSKFINCIFCDSIDDRPNNAIFSYVNENQSNLINDFSRAIIDNASFAMSNAETLVFYRSIIKNYSSFFKIVCKKLVISNALIFDAEFSETSINLVQANKVELRRSSFYKAIFDKFECDNATIEKCDFTEMKAKRFVCKNSNILFTKFNNINIEDATFFGTEFTDSTFLFSQLKNVSFYNCEGLKASDFKAAQIENVNFKGTKILIKDLKKYAISVSESSLFDV